jgi:DNA-binding HxlR family transcriptional regulator
MDDTKLERLLNQKYAQVVLEVLLDAEGGSYAFSALRDEVNAVVADDSRGAKETVQDGEYSPASLSSILSEAEDAGVVTRFLNGDGEKRWRLCASKLSRSQIAKLRSRNTGVHTDTSSLDLHHQGHIDSTFS